MEVSAPRFVSPRRRGSTPFILQVCSFVAMAALVLPPPTDPAMSEFVSS